MKKNNKFYIIELIILIFIIMFEILNNKIPSNYAYLVDIIFWFLISISLILIGGFPRNKNYYQKSSVKIVFIVFLIYILIIFLLGLFLGFVKNLYFYDFIMLIKNILPIALFIVASEVARYLFLKHNPTKTQIITFTLELIILNIIIEINNYNLADPRQIFVMISILAIPTIASETMSTYVTYNVGFVPTLIYNLLFKLYSYVVPFNPNLGDYLQAVFGVFVPYVLYREVSKTLKYREKYAVIAKRQITKVLGIILITFLLIIILLVSGIFKYQLIAIATGSMEPVYYRGDAIIYEKVNPNEVNVGDILVYQASGGIVTHRVINIIEINGKKQFYTKGDNNEIADKVDIKEENVKGVVRYIVKYMGYPTILLNELLESK